MKVAPHDFTAGSESDGFESAIAPSSGLEQRSSPARAEPSIGLPEFRCSFWGLFCWLPTKAYNTKGDDLVGFLLSGFAWCFPPDRLLVRMRPEQKSSTDMHLAGHEHERAVYTHTLFLKHRFPK